MLMEITRPATGPRPLGHGRFMQADPIGYEAGMNLYGYVRGDPVNFTDPSGTQAYCDGPNCDGDTVVVRAGGGSAARILSGISGRFMLDMPIEGPGGGGLLGDLLGPVFEELDEQARRLREQARNAYCSLPSLGLSATSSFYRGAGGGLTTEIAFDPRSGRLSFSFGQNVGVGVGVGGGFSPTAGRNVPDGWSANVGVNANAQFGPVSAGTSYTLVGPNGPQFNGISGRINPGSTGATANANLTGRVSYGGQIVPGCE